MSHQVPRIRQIFGTILDTAPFTATGTSLGANVTGSVMAGTQDMQNISYQFWIDSGTPDGSFIVEVSNDPRCANPKSVTDGNVRFETCATVTFTAGLSSGSAGCAVLVQNGWTYSRARWVRTGGTGTGFCMANGVAT